MFRWTFGWCMLAICASIAMAEPVKPAVPLKAEPFDLRDVKLLDGPFKHAMEMDRQYLLSLAPERLLHAFYLNAGLPSSIEPLGGWEAPKCEVRGHFVGHYLSACAMLYRATGDPQIKANADAVVAGMAKCQAKFPNGYLSAYPEEFFDRLEAGQHVWAPWYTIHKIYAGLLDMYTLAGNEQALEVLKKAADWVDARESKLSEAQMQKTLDNEHGGMNEVLANLYAVTGEQKYLKLAQKFYHHKVLDPLAAKDDKLDKLHANTQFPKVIGLAKQYILTGDESLHTAADFFWSVVTRERSYVIGGNSDGEHFSPKAHLSQHIGPASTETCNTYNMLKLTRVLFTCDPRPDYADFYERALYNHILASQHPQTGMTTYYMPLRSGSARGDGKPMGFCTPLNSFWCCTGTGVENHVKYNDSIYFHDADKALYLNLFIPSELDWQSAGVRVRQETQYPLESSTKLTFSCQKPVEFALRVRRPYWATSSFTIKINGQEQALQSAPGSYVTLSRAWQTGDVLDISMPMSLRTEAFRDNPKRLALMYGPMVLCAATASGNRSAIILADESHVLDSVKPVEGKPCTFTAPGAIFRRGPAANAADPVIFTPFHTEFTNAYIVYWDVMTAEQAAQLEQREREQLKRKQELAARTLDCIDFTAESDKAHHLAGQKTASGEHAGRFWRHATAGGYFTFELAVSGDVSAVNMVCTYWGSDGGREFEILVDGRKIATQKLDHSHPDEFFEATYPVPAELLKDKKKVTVRFQGLPGKTAGGVFECRLIRASAN